MKARQIILLFLFTLLVSMVRAAEQSQSSTDTGSRFIAYYFHGTVRCETCLNIEKHARAAITEQFRSRISTNGVSFASVDYDLPANKHFLNDFKLPCPSLVLAERTLGKTIRWKLLGRTWDVAHEPEKLKSYVIEEVRQFLASQSISVTNGIARPRSVPKG